MLDEQARLLYNSPIAAGFYQACLQAPQLAQTVQPGQFVNIQVSPGLAPLFRLPLSISGADGTAGTIEVLYEKVGPKTQALAQAEPDTVLPVLGPLGTGFALPARDRLVLLVGGGIGVPPLLYWGWRLRQQGT